jgi:formylglycine-generating enzyme required for sulfatase activity
VDDTGKQQEYGLVKPLFLDEHPAHIMDLNRYYMDVHEVTNHQYKKFMRMENRTEPIPWSQNGN